MSEEKDTWWLAYKIEDRKMSLKVEGVRRNDALTEDFRQLAEKYINE
jgi:hypothetical protein